MTKKKDKDGGGSGNAERDASGDIFKTLFGGDVAAASSIFSDTNPFKRIPEKRTIPTPLEPASDSKKSKKSKTLIPNSGSQLGEPLKAEEKKKKRKRDDVEKECEARRYGESVKEEEEEEKVGALGKRKKRDEEVAAEMAVSKHGEGEEAFDDEEKLMRTVFVGNLPLKVKKKAIVKEFESFGEIESVRIRSVPIADTKIPRKGAVILQKFNDTADSVHAYIVFKTKESAEGALAHNMAVVGGNHIRVDRACPPRKKLKGDSSPLYDSKRTVFLGNLPFDVKDEEIYQLFSGIKGLESSLEGVRVIRDPHIGLGKGIAYVLFKTRETANLALKRRNLKIRDRELRISHAKENSTPSKRGNPFSSDTDRSATKKKSAIESRTDDHTIRSNAGGAMSYQGLRANKAGGQKRGHLKNWPVEKKSNTEEQKEKRPSVAARKAKAKALKDIGASKHAGGKKRKLEGRTPDSLNQKLKAKKFRPGKF